MENNYRLILGRSRSDTTVKLKIKGSNITSTEEIVNAFNEYFTHIGPNIANSILDPMPRLSNLSNLLNQNSLVYSWSRRAK